MADDERSRLHEIVDRLPEAELTLACQIMELLAHGSAALRAGSPNTSAAPTNGHDDDDAAPATSPETLAKLSQLSDDELLRLEALLDADLEGARAFWRERYGDELPDEELIEDEHP